MGQSLSESILAAGWVPGFPELVLILLIVLLLFGSTKLAGLGKGLGDGIRNFRKGLKGGEDDGEAPKTDVKK
jgi:sec-independent protein translocase protein TatA